MDWYLAQQNLAVAQPEGTVFTRWGDEYKLAPTGEIALLVANGALIPRAADGTYPVPPAPGYSAGPCCRNMAGG